MEDPDTKISGSTQRYVVLHKNNKIDTTYLSQHASVAIVAINLPIHFPTLFKYFGMKKIVNGICRWFLYNVVLFIYVLFICEDIS